MNTKYTAEEKLRTAVSFKNWHYEFDLGDGIITQTTRENHMKWHNLRRNFFMQEIEKSFNGSLKGKTFLDIACNAGFWSFELAKRGASYILAVDIFPEYIKQAEFVRDCIQKNNEFNNIEFKNINIFDLPVPNRKFDMVLALGIVYHLTDPVGFFRKVHELTKYCVFIDTAVSTLNINEPVLEIGSSQKRACCSNGEFCFIPTENALSCILRHTGFSKQKKLNPPRDKKYNAFIEGRRIAMLAFKN